MIKAYAARDSVEAHFLCDLLESAGVRAAVLGEYLATGRGQLPMTQETLPSVWVNEEDAPRAAEVLRDYREAPAIVSKAPWKCPGCGEEIEGAFSECWQCGRAGPE